MTTNQHTAADPMRGAVSELREWIGCTALLQCESLRVPVRCVDARRRWNRTDVLVEPIAGEGEQWVSTSRLVVMEVE